MPYLNYVKVPCPLCNKYHSYEFPCPQLLMYRVIRDLKLKIDRTFIGDCFHSRSVDAIATLTSIKANLDNAYEAIEKIIYYPEEKPSGDTSDIPF